MLNKCVDQSDGTYSCFCDGPGWADDIIGGRRRCIPPASQSTHISIKIFCRNVCFGFLLSSPTRRRRHLQSSCRCSNDECSSKANPLNECRYFLALLGVAHLLSFPNFLHAILYPNTRDNMDGTFTCLCRAPGWATPPVHFSPPHSVKHPELRSLLHKLHFRVVYTAQLPSRSACRMSVIKKSFRATSVWITKTVKVHSVSVHENADHYSMHALDRPWSGNISAKQRDWGAMWRHKFTMSPINWFQNMFLHSSQSYVGTYSCACAKGFDSGPYNLTCTKVSRPMLIAFTPPFWQLHAGIRGFYRLILALNESVWNTVGRLRAPQGVDYSGIQLAHQSGCFPHHLWIQQRCRQFQGQPRQSRR